MNHKFFWVLTPITLLATFAATHFIPPSVDSRVNQDLNKFKVSALEQTKEIVQKFQTIISNFSESTSSEDVLLAKASVPTNLSALEQGIIAETNRARTNPVAYAAQIQKLRSSYQGKILKLPGGVNILTQEGVKPVDEAVRALKATKPVRALRPSKGMSLGAKDHVKDQGPKGATGHNSSDGSHPWDRVSRYGSWQTIIGENIAYGPNTAQQVVMQLIIDDGVSDRGHRKNIFTPGYRVTGVACGSHKKYRIMCVIEYAGGYKEKR